MSIVSSLGTVTSQSLASGPFSHIQIGREMLDMQQFVSETLLLSITLVPSCSATSLLPFLLRSVMYSMIFSSPPSASRRHSMASFAQMYGELSLVPTNSNMTTYGPLWLGGSGLVRFF